MSFPRKKILDRINSNVDTLIATGQKLSDNMFLGEIDSPFRSSGASGDASPFLKTLFPEIRLAAMLERSLNTALGWGWDKIAGDIAQGVHGNSIVGYFVEGSIPASTSTQIDALVLAYTSGDNHLSPDLNDELSQLLPTLRSPGARESIREKDDMFYIKKDGTEVHVEIKTPKPNYDQMRAAKRRILRIITSQHPKKTNVIVGMPYNPNGLFGEYGWPTTKYFMDFGNDILIGKNFWDFIGDSDSTYEKLIDCFVTVALSRRADLKKLMR